ncbi:hypothetical protein BTVI_35729 [Pitangus sulphuratus]|nr:hypothetical protein BTVI_35729 [Pitangus sulphuratus]
MKGKLKFELLSQFIMQEHSDDNLSYSVKTRNGTYLLKLKKNKGVLYIGGKWYGMEPLNTSNTFEHVFYELEEEQDVPFHCGVLNGSLQLEQMFVEQAVEYTFSSNTTSGRVKILREKRAVLPQKSYVELFVVVDNKRFLLKNSDPAAVQKETVELINYVDGFKVAGAECRAKRDFCDLPEYCSGSSAYCPEDVYIMNGHPCSNNKAYCYYGVCQSFDSQCEAIYGKGARKAPDICFEKANIKGDRFGNCGMKGGVYKKCPVQHSLCGKLQCTSVSLQNLPTWSVVNNASGVLCWSSDFDLGSDIPDPAQVHDGTACGENKACVGFECVDAMFLGYNCDVKQRCNNNGVCNNNGNCHCNAGWAPPFCNQSGYGGSVDSGPAHTDTSLRDGLLIFFFLVLPVAIVAALAIIKRDAMRRKFCRKSRRQHRDNNVQEAKQDNKPSHDTRNDQERDPENPGKKKKVCIKMEKRLLCRDQLTGKDKTMSTDPPVQQGVTSSLAVFMPIRECELGKRVPGWKRSRRELLQCLEGLLRALLTGAPLPGPAQPGWERLLRCCRPEGLLEAARGDGGAAARPLWLLLDDNFYYRSMRYEVYQLARKYSLGFCQLFLDCPLECCLQRNRLRSDPVPEQTILLMARKIEMPDLKKNAWEQHSLILSSSDCISENNEQIMNLLATALENPARPNEEDTEQKDTDRAICAASAVHQADQACRRVISQAMKDARDKNVLPSEMKSLAEELNKLKAEFLDDLRQGETLKTQNSDPATSVVSSFQQEATNVVNKYILK